MAITTKDLLVAAAAAAQPVQMFKSGARTTVANAWFSTFDLAGSPGAGVLAGTSVAAGVVPDATTVGCPALTSFGANTGYLTSLEVSNTVPGRHRLFDMLFKAGAFPFNAVQTLAAQPSFSARIPAANYNGTSIWLECVTAFTGLQSIAVTYTNQAGTTGRTTGTIATGVAPTVGRMLQLPLQAGDTGVQKIESVTSTVATVGTFNLLILRSLVDVRVRIANDLVRFGPDSLMQQVYASSALVMLINADGATSGLPEIQVAIGNG